jgi:hypothetical protein
MKKPNDQHPGPRGGVRKSDQKASIMGVQTIKRQKIEVIYQA